MPHRFLPILLAAWLLAGAGLAHAGPFTGGPTLDDPLVHRSTRFTFPARFSTFQRALPRQYDKDGEDFSIAYDSLLPPLSVTVFVYPAANRRLEDELARRQSEITILHPDAKLLFQGAAELSPGKVPARRASYRYRATFGEDEQTVLSDLLLARCGDRFVAYPLA